MKLVASLIAVLCAGDVCAGGDASLATLAGVRRGATAEPAAADTFGALAEALRGLAEQAEALRRGLEELPRSEEAQRLAEEWRRLLAEIAQAQGDAEESLREDVLPRLQEELEALEKRFEELRPRKHPGGAPMAI